MSVYHASLVGVLMGTLLAGPVLAQAGNNACLQRNRVASWRAFDDNTIVYKDRQMNEFTVTLRNSCRGLTRSDAVLIYPRASSLSCISTGDAVGVKAPGLAGATCRVASVKTGAPAQAPGNDQAPVHEVADQAPGG